MKRRIRHTAAAALAAALTLAAGAASAPAREVAFGPEGARLALTLPPSAGATPVPNGLAVLDGGCALGLATGRLHGLPLEAAAKAVAGAAGARAERVEGAQDGAGAGRDAAWRFEADGAGVLFFEADGRYVMVARQGDETRCRALLDTLRGLNAAAGGGAGTPGSGKDAAADAAGSARVGASPSAGRPAGEAAAPVQEIDSAGPD